MSSCKNKQFFNKEKIIKLFNHKDSKRNQRKFHDFICEFVSQNNLDLEALIQEVNSLEEIKESIKKEQDFYETFKKYIDYIQEQNHDNLLNQLSNLEYSNELKKTLIF